MIRVKNQKVITKLSKQSLQANRVRNIVAVFAVALTSLLFMTLFTIAGTMVYTFQQQTFRLVGSSGHGSFKDLTLEQKEILEKDAMVQECGGRLFLGVGSGEKFRKVHAELSYMEPGYLKRSFCTPQQGRIPQEGTKEIACDTRILNCIGIQPDIGARLTFTYEVGGMEKTEITDTFVLSGWWEYDQAAPASMAILPKSYVEEMVKRYPRKEGDMMDMTDDPGQRTIAAVYLVDDYNSPIEYSQWAKVGDTINIHYVYEWEYFDDETGEQISKEEAWRKKRPIRAEEKESADMEYRVAACVAVKNAMSYRGYSGFEYVMNAQVFSNDSHTSDIMTYLFNTTEESNASMQAYLEDYTNNVNQNLDFESKQKYVQAFERYRKMFLLMGGALSFVVGMVGILNFFNAVLTSICTRRREFAVLQSIGMTNRQLKKMLMSEGLLYAAAAVVVSVMCTLLMSPIMDRVVSGIF